MLYGFAHRAFLIIVFQTSVLRLVAAVTEIPVVKVSPSLTREQVSERNELSRREKDSEFLCFFFPRVLLSCILGAILWTVAQ